MNRLEARGWCCQCDHRQIAHQLGEHVEKRILAAEDDRRAEDRPRKTGPHDDFLGLALTPQIATRTCTVGVECAHVQQPCDVRGPACGDNGARKLNMHAVEGDSRRALVHNADQVDDGIGTAEQVGHCGAIVRIALNDFNRRQQQQMTGSCTTPRDDEDAPRRSGKRGRQMAADEPAAAQHDNAGEAGHYSAWVTTAAALRGMIVPSRVDSETYGRLSAFAYSIVFASTFFT